MKPGSPRRYATVAACIVILAAIVPWRSFQDHPHWDKVGWLPFVTPIQMRDLLANVVLFAPLGASLAWNGASARLGRIAGVAATLSITGEATQIYAHSRFPSATDVVANVCGALVAAVLVKSIRTTAIAD